MTDKKTETTVPVTSTFPHRSFYGRGLGLRSSMALARSGLWGGHGGYSGYGGYGGYGHGFGGFRGGYGYGGYPGAWGAGAWGLGSRVGLGSRYVPACTTVTKAEVKAEVKAEEKVEAKVESSVA
jgi:hypothetical protein